MVSYKTLSETKKIRRVVSIVMKIESLQPYRKSRKTSVVNQRSKEKQVK